ncbi:MAG TPA: 1,4-alpha-glucan branching protein domain-containing protein [Gemmatimonadales bacterium]|nr:1,4-alpha-glucan branching protein domain-containing protein [Gemmatimonadales bacterium]
MDFVLALHSHLPWVLNHGRWPHGSDWLCEAALDSYLPLLEQLTALEAEDVPAPVTLGITPVLANQLAHPAFRAEMEHFLDHRLDACRRGTVELAAQDQGHLVPVADFWGARLARLRDVYRALGGDLVTAFADLARRGRIELISSGATHGYLPLLGRDESVRLQLVVGRREHTRLFGQAPAGCWLPECAYRPRGTWSHRPDRQGVDRPGTEEHVAAAGFSFFFVDAHLAAAGTPLGAYHDVPLGAERFDASRHDPDSPGARRVERSPYQSYVVSSPPTPPVTAFVRDPRTSMQVWSRDHGYPGDEWYLEFHKIRWPGGLKLWRVTGPRTDLGAKQPWDPKAAFDRASLHADHFAQLLQTIARDERAAGQVIVAPFDTELFGHWWFEGVHFLGETYRRLRDGAVYPTTASIHVARRRAGRRIRLAEGSWGARGDHTMWLNDATRWTWERLWPLEDAFWTVAPHALRDGARRPVLASAARQLLLAQSSDWQFIISTGLVTDYAERRFDLHASDAARLIAGLGQEASADERAAALALSRDVDHRDGLFPDVLEAVAEVLDGTPSHGERSTRT